MAHSSYFSNLFRKNALPLVTIPLKNSHKYLIKKSKAGPTLCCEKLLEIWVRIGFRLLRVCSDEVRRVIVQEHTVQDLRYFPHPDLCKWWEPWRTEMKTAEAGKWSSFHVLFSSSLRPLHTGKNRTFSLE